MSIDIHEEIVTFEDGYKYFWPKGCRGAFSSHNLRWIADRLDELNTAWDKDISDYFFENPE